MAGGERIIPNEIEGAYFPNGLRDEQLLSGGMVNTATLRATTPDGTNHIVQELSPIFGEAITDDYLVVSDHLRDDGWEMPHVERTVDGQPYTKDKDGNTWRTFEYLNSDPSVLYVDRLGEPVVYGVLLGKLHRSLATLDYEPSFALPHFHDTAYHAQVLAETVPALPTPESQAFAAEVLETYQSMPALPETEPQLIHGDPRTANILHRDGKPFTFIDWDTLMKGTIWMDIGDMLRSVAENEVMAGRPILMDTLLSVAEGYRQVGFPDMQPADFHELALRATQVIAAELTMRFAADYKDGKEGYFGWDETSYASRHEHNMYRARKQWDIFNGVEAYLSQGEAA